MVLVVALVPYGPLLAAVTLMAAAAWQGREGRKPSKPEGPDESQTERLKSLYEALVPYFSLAGDPSPSTPTAASGRRRSPRTSSTDRAVSPTS